MDRERILDEVRVWISESVRAYFEDRRRSYSNRALVIGLGFVALLVGGTILGIVTGGEYGYGVGNWASVISWTGLAQLVVLLVFSYQVYCVGQSGAYRDARDCVSGEVDVEVRVMEEE